MFGLPAIASAGSTNAADTWDQAVDVLSRWYDRFRSGGLEALQDKPPKPDRVWNRIPDDIRQRVVRMAFEQPEFGPRELAIRFTDTNSY